jgi:hypothetical protein
MEIEAAAKGKTSRAKEIDLKDKTEKEEPLEEKAGKKEA